MGHSGVVRSLRQAWVICFLAGCAAPSQKPAPNAWLLKPDWTDAGAFRNTTLKGRSGQSHQLSGAHLANLKTVLLAIREQSGIDPQLALIASDTPNAFATMREGKQLIGITLPMLDGIGLDRDALATTVGHELAHLKLNHGDIRKQREKSARGVSDVLGVILGVAGVPMGGTIASVGIGVITTAYSRDEEREADELGLHWAMAAGYSACGSARTMRLLKEQGRAAPLPFLASHPGHDERIERADKAALAATGTGC